MLHTQVLCGEWRHGHCIHLLQPHFTGWIIHSASKWLHSCPQSLSLGLPTYYPRHASFYLVSAPAAHLTGRKWDGFSCIWVMYYFVSYSSSCKWFLWVLQGKRSRIKNRNVCFRISEAFCLLPAWQHLAQLQPFLPLGNSCSMWTCTLPQNVFVQDILGVPSQKHPKHPPI